MCLYQRIKNCIKRCDLLASSPTLRVRGEQTYSSTFGGLFSIAVMSFFIYLFILKIVEVLSYVNITSVLSQVDQIQSQQEINNITIAIGLRDFKLDANTRYFDFQLKQQSIISGKNGGIPTFNSTRIKLSPCNVNDWKALGDHFQEQFNAFSMNNMLCIENNQTYKLKGYQGSPDFTTLNLLIKKCTNNSHDVHPCASNDAITNYINSYLTANDFFWVKFFIVDTVITPSNINPISKIIEKKVFLSFTDTLGSMGSVQFGRYQVETDTSLLPYSTTETITGSYLYKHNSHTVGMKSNNYVRVIFTKSTTQLTISRLVGKIDQTLSYVGGLFGLLFVIVQFFLASFNEIRYQIYASQAAFTFDQSGRKIKEKDFGFFSYIGYSIYDWLNTFGLAPNNWKKMRQIDQVRQQINSQLDVTYLMRKIRSLEKITSCLMNQNKRICALLTKQPTLTETQTERKLLQIYSSLLPSPCQDHFSRHKNKTNYLQNEKSEKNIILSGQKMLQSDSPSISQNISCINQQIQQEDQDFKDLMSIIKHAYSQIQMNKDQLSERILLKIPQKIKKIIQKSRLNQKIVIQDFGFLLKKSSYNNLDHNQDAQNIKNNE